MRKEIIGLILVAMLCVACAAAAIAQTTPFVISGYIFNPDGSPCNGSDIHITNLNTSVNWNVETHPASNYYRLVIDSNNVSTGDILLFNISNSSQSLRIEDTITGTNIGNAGLTSFNFTFTSDGTTVPVLHHPFVISGYIFNPNGSPCSDPDVHITNLNTSMNWIAETHTTSNYYRLVLDSSNVSTGAILRFNISGSSQSQTIEYNITSSHIENGGLTSFNHTFPPHEMNISGYKINDTNGNGLWNLGEQGIHGWNITLKNATGAVMSTTSTSPQGYYEFTNLLPGSYNVSEEDKAGWMHTNASFKQVTLVDNDLTNLNFTNRPVTTTVPVLHHPFLISGYLFNPDGNPCNDPDVYITNLNTSVNWDAETHTTSNYYRLVLDSSNVSTGAILRFNISGSSRSMEIEHTITGSNIENGGLTSFNVTFASNGINLSGYKINDTNGNGLWNPGEQGIQGWSITLKNATGAVISTASTNSQGYYEFTNLLPGSYNVSEEDKAGWMHTNASFKQVTLVDKDLTNLNFTNRPVTHAVPVLHHPFVISGYIFNPDGSPCNGPDVHITDLNTSMNWTAETQTTSNYYRLVLDNSNVSTGDILRFNISGSSQSFKVEHTITGSDIENAGLTSFNHTFPPHEMNLSGYKINDTNDNGLWNLGEQGIHGWNITLKNATGAVVSTASTSPQGYYEFTNLLPGSYNVSEEDKAGWMHTNASFKQVTLAGKDLTNLNFTNRLVTITVPVLHHPFLISGYIFNPDGSPCNGPDVHITHLNTSVNWTAETHPASNYYRLILDSSNVSTSGILRFNISGSSQSQTIEYNITCSDIENGGLTSFNHTFASNGINISGYKINDTNGNGLWNPGEQGIQGWNITLKNTTGAVISTASTNPQGYYEFTNLLPDSYNVSEEDKAGWMHTTASFKQVTLADKDLTNLNFTNKLLTVTVPVLHHPFLISGYIFNPDGNPCNGPDVHITDLNTSVNWTAETHITSNYYRLVLDSNNVSTGDILQFNISSSSQSLTDEHTITYSDTENGGLTSFNFSFAASGTTVPELGTPFVISGWTHYRDGTEYNNPVLTTTNLQTGDNWHPMTRSGCNYYRLILNTTNISSGDVLQFNLTDSGSINLTDHTITPDDINRSGLFDFNLTFGTAAIPDIAVEVEISEYMYPDYPDEIYVTVKNIGITDVGLFNISFDVNETLVDTITISSLPAGENTAVHFIWKPKDTGNYAVSITADPEDQLNESNRDNNKITKNVNVTPVSIIHVPDDYSTIQDAIDHAKPHTFIYLREGEHWLSAGNKYSPITINDKHHLKLIGSSKCAKIMIRTGFINPPGLDMILIFNSSHIELRGFTAEALGINENTRVQNIRLVAVKRSDNITLTDMILHHNGYTEDSQNNAIKLVNSEHCRIVSNVLSGKEERSLTEPVGNVGISLVHSKNNLIRNNTIYHFVQCINLADNNTLNNTLYLNNLFPHENGGIAAIDHGCNHWNSAASMKYLYNASEYRNYIGNYWNGFTGNDSNGDGIAESPYTSGGITDHYPLVEPHDLTFNLMTAGIARPSLIYTGRENTILASIERKGTYPVSERLEVKLTVNDIEVESRVITMKNGQNRILRFIWVPEDAGAYNLTIDVHPENEMREMNVTDNEFSINVMTSSPMFNYTGNIIPALDFLNSLQMPKSGSLSGFSNSAWAALGITAVGEDPASGRWKPYENSLIDYLRNEPEDSVSYLSPGTNPCALTTTEDFARMILAISATGEDPTNFGAVNYLVMLKSFYDGEQFGTPDIVEDDALAILALVSCGDKDIGMISNAASNIKDQQKEDGRWISPYGNSDVKTTSLVIQALIAAGENRDSQVIKNALNYFKTTQIDNGGFSDIITTSYAIQAMTAAGENPLTYTKNSNNPLDYLVSLQQDDGSFNYTANLSLFPSRTTIFAPTALYGAPHPVLIKTVRDDYKLPDVSIGDIMLENEICVNTTYTLTADIRSNGGIFDTTLFCEGVPVENKSIWSVWQNSMNTVSFQWKPDRTGIHNLSIAADSNNRITELYEHNNVLTCQVNVSLPDLYPHVINQPSETYVNATNTIMVSINGTTDESFNVTLEADGELLGNKRIDKIRNSVTLPFEWRPSRPGIHTLELVVDPDADVAERNETNNILTEYVNVTLPDLIPLAVNTCPVYVNATNNIIVSVGGTAEYFNVSLLENGTVVGKISNITCYTDTNVSIIWKPARLGNCTIKAVIDSDDDIAETNETNNNMTQEFEVTLPDIIPEQITPTILFLNETNRITIAVNGTAEGFNASLFANDTHIGKKVDLDTYNGSIWFDWTPDTNGTYNLTVCLDSDNDVAETNETNNNLAASVIAAKRIDLELLSPLGGEIWTGIVNITWNAIYEEPVSIDLFYTANLGYSWNVIAANITNNESYMWDTGDVIDGKYQIKVVARWGAITEEDRSDLFYVYNKNSASEWGEFHSNAGFSLSETPDTPDIAWLSDDIGAEGSSSLIVADGKIFVYCAGWNQLYSDYTYLVALSESNGEVLWGTQIAPREYGSWATPTYHNGKLYVSSGRGVYCIDATKENRGPVLWTFTFPDGGGSVNGGPAVTDGKVYVGSWDGGHYYCLNANNGSEIWEFTIVKNSQSVPAVAYGRVYFGDFRYPDVKSKVYSVDMTDAYEFWNTTVDWNVCGSITVSDGVIYFTTYNFNGPGMLYALDAGNGTEMWKNSIITTDSTPAFYAPSSSPRSYIYISSGFGGHKIYCFDVRNGESIWEKEGLGSWTNSPAVSADKKVFVGKEGTGMVPGYAGLYCLDAFTGDVLWHSDYGGSSPAIANGKVYTIGGGRAIAFGSTTLPDLTVEKLYVPDEINVEETVVITAQINNIGESDVIESFSVALTHKGNQIDKRTISSLDVGNVTNVSFNWTPQQTGNHRLMVTVDADDTVTESDPMNNWLTRDVTVEDYQPDLAVTAIEAPYVNPIGRNINMTVHIQNIGSETNSTFDVGLMINNRLENNTTTSLQNNDGGDNNRTSVRFNWTPDAAGTYSLTGTVDLDDDADKTNNRLTKMIEVVTNETFFGYGLGSGGGTGGGTAGGIGSGHGTGESGEAGSGGMKYPDDSSKSVKERSSDISGFLFGDAISGRSGGGGVLPVAFIICLIVILGLLYYGHRSEKRSFIDAKHHLQPPDTYRRKNG